MPPTTRRLYVTGHTVMTLRHPSIGMGFNWRADLWSAPGVRERETDTEICASSRLGARGHSPHEESEGATRRPIAETLPTLFECCVAPQKRTACPLLCGTHVIHSVSGEGYPLGVAFVGGGMEEDMEPREGIEPSYMALQAQT